jgi:NAD dependent epimerase/dehydratase family enzyme
MRTIIAGGSGLIGRALVKELVQAGHEAVILSRSPRSLAGLPAGVQVVGWDGKSGQGWAHLVEGAGALVNLAGENIAGEAFFPARWTAERKARIRQSRLDAGQALVSAVQAAQSKPQVLVQSSAIGFYGPQAFGAPALDESSPPGSDFMATLCQECGGGAGGAAGGHSLRRCAQQPGRRFHPPAAALQILCRWAAGQRAAGLILDPPGR